MRVEELVKARKSKIKFKNQKLDFTGVQDRRDWYNADHRTKFGAKVAGPYMKYSVAGNLYKAGKEDAKLVKRLVKKVF
jgi:hypothetical protein